MAGIKSISDVKDLYDLIELYAELDRNADGLLGAGEVPAEEIAAGDQGGVGSANFDVKDGFLSPWEVAQLREFKWKDVRPLRIANQIHRKTFNNIENLPEDLSTGRCVFQSGSSLRFHANGKVRAGVLGQDFQYYEFKFGNLFTVPVGSLFLDDAARRNHTYVFSKSADINRVHVPPKTLVVVESVDRDTSITLTAPHDAPIMKDGVAYSRIHLESLGGMYPQKRTLARDGQVPLFPGCTTRVPLPKGQEIEFWGDNIHDVKFTAPYRIWGFDCSSGVTLSFFIGNTSREYFLRPKNETSTVRWNGNAIKQVIFRWKKDVGYEGMEVEAASQLRMRVGNGVYSFSSLSLDRMRRVTKGKLAEDIPSPYGSSFIHRAGTEVSFFEDGTLVKGTPECFKHRYPHIVLSGSVANDDIMFAYKGFERMTPQMRAAIPGIHFGYDEVPLPYSRDKQRGQVNPFNRVIYVKKGEVESPMTVEDLIHEGAHILHYALQNQTARRIAAATRHLDLTQSEDLAEEAAISGSIWNQSFDARWSRASGYDFSFSFMDLLDAFASRMSYEARVASGQEKDREQPHEGFVNHYARIDIWEHVAMHVQYIAKDPSKYRELIDPNSAHYRNHLDRPELASRYRRQLDLLFQDGFITEAQYREIVPLPPSIASFCAREAVNCR